MKKLVLSLAMFALISSASAQTINWLKQFSSGLSVSSKCNNLGVDASSNVYAVGNFFNTINFGGTSLAAVNGQNLFNAKYTSAGALLWVSQISGNLNVGYDASTDASGNTYITANFSAAVNVSGITLTPTFGYNSFVAKYNSSGTLLWVTQLANNSSGSSVLSSKIAFDAAGNAFIIGNFTKSANFSGGFTFTNSNYNNVFVVKYNSSGVVQWVQTGGGAINNTAVGTSLCVDGSGNVFAYGKCQGIFTFFGTSYNQPKPAIFIATFTNTGGLATIFTAEETQERLVRRRMTYKPMQLATF